uniref:Putative secreted protein n=1 Tax=Ixodes ricinus TaxID=34613 RepID=A0A6B0TWE0_IXORI
MPGTRLLPLCTTAGTAPRATSLASRTSPRTSQDASRRWHAVSEASPTSFRADSSTSELSPLPPPPTL